MEPPNQTNTPIKKPSIFHRITVVHLILIVSLIIVAEIFWAYRSVIIPNNQKTNVTSDTVQKVQVANKISLTTPKNEFKVGEDIPVTINIESNKKTAGVDLVIRYDPNLLVIDRTAKIPVVAGNLYTDYPINKSDEKQGSILISGVTSKMDGVIPKGVFGTILFKAKAVGGAKISLEFVKGSTTDTNIIESQSAKDILEQVDNLDLVIKP